MKKIIIIALALLLNLGFVTQSYSDVNGVPDCWWDLQHVQGNFKKYKTSKRVYGVAYILNDSDINSLLIQIRDSVSGDTVRLSGTRAADFLVTKGYLQYSTRKSRYVGTNKYNHFGGGSGTLNYDTDPGRCSEPHPNGGPGPDWKPEDGLLDVPW